MDGYDQAFRICNEDLYNTHLRAPDVLMLMFASVCLRRSSSGSSLSAGGTFPHPRAAPFLSLRFFLIPSVRDLQHSPANTATRTTIASARTRVVGESTVASDVVSLIQSHNVLPNCELSSLSESFFPFPSSAITCIDFRFSLRGIFQ